MKEKVLFYARKFVIFIIAVMSLLTLCFTFIGVEVNSPYGSVSKIALTGFDFITKPIQNLQPHLSYNITIYDPIFVFILISAIFLILFSVINVFIKNNQLDLIIIVTSLCLGVAYLSVAIHKIDIVCSSFSNRDVFITTTATYIPLILQTLLVGVYYAVSIFVKKGLSFTMNVKEKKIVSNNSYVDDIKRLKDLLDMGAINQEEFDAKKKEILGL